MSVFQAKERVAINELVTPNPSHLIFYVQTEIGCNMFVYTRIDTFFGKRSHFIVKVNEHL